MIRLAEAFFSAIFVICTIFFVFTGSLPNVTDIPILTWIIAIPYYTIMFYNIYGRGLQK